MEAHIDDVSLGTNTQEDHVLFFLFFEAWRSPAEKTHSLLTLRGSSKDGRYVHFRMFYIKA